MPEISNATATHMKANILVPNCASMLRSRLTFAKTLRKMTNNVVAITVAIVVRRAVSVVIRDGSTRSRREARWWAESGINARGTERNVKIVQVKKSAAIQFDAVRTRESAETTVVGSATARSPRPHQLISFPSEPHTTPLACPRERGTTKKTATYSSPQPTAPAARSPPDRTNTPSSAARSS
jgi:hypothetical protein